MSERKIIQLYLMKLHLKSKYYQLEYYSLSNTTRVKKALIFKYYEGIKVPLYQTKHKN
jgi:hypothetical protein